MTAPLALEAPSKKPITLGRPSKYRKAYADVAFRQSLLGKTEREIADLIGISPDTMTAWKQTYPEFSKAIARGKGEADGEIAKSLYHRAKGYSHKAVKIFMPAGATEPVYAEYTEHYPPDTQAASLWLRNRQPKLWRDLAKVDVDVNVTHELSPETLAAIESVTQALIEQRQAPAIEGTFTAIESPSDLQAVVSEAHSDGETAESETQRKR